jgi:hypothetical protein
MGHAYGRTLVVSFAQKYPEHPGKKKASAYTYFLKLIGSTVSGTVSVSDGDGTKLRLLAYNLNITPYDAGGTPRSDLTPVWDGLWEAVDFANNNNATFPAGGGTGSSVSQADGGETVYFGFYDTISTYGMWMYVFTGLRYSNGSCCASQAAWPNQDGSLHVEGAQNGWTDVRFDMTGTPYHDVVHYADDDNDGIAFYFYRPTSK